jgi:hypothetical protein
LAAAEDVASSVVEAVVADSADAEALGVGAVVVVVVAVSSNPVLFDRRILTDSH